MSKRPQARRCGDLIGAHRSMRRLFDMIEKVAKVDTSVLIVGETGTGKDLVAQAIHQRSNRAGNAFVAVNMGMLTSDLVASELFGHRKGAFTGASENKAGRFVEADRGTLFLDEIATMDESTQVTLLRVLDSGTFRPIGAKNDRQVDVRLLAATNQNLRQAAAMGEFREDLIHRLEVVRLDVPPLRDRADDIPLLAEHFLRHYRTEFAFQDSGISGEALDLLRTYEWPGNVRELKNAIAQAVVTAQDACVGTDDLPRRITSRASTGQRIESVPEDDTQTRPVRSDSEGLYVASGQTLDDVQKAYVLHTLERCGNNKTLAARELGLSRKTLYSRLDRWKCR